MESKKYLVLASFLVMLIVAYYNYQIHLTKNLYNIRKKRIEKPQSIIQIIALGDSLTEGLYNWPKYKMFYPYTKRLQLHLKIMNGRKDFRVINAGKSGEYINQIKKRLAILLRNKNFNNGIVLILAGTNDYVNMVKLTKNVENESVLIKSAEQIAYDIEELHRMCFKQNKTTVILSIPEVNIEKRKSTMFYRKYRNLINNHIRAFSLDHINNTVFIDLSFEMMKLELEGISSNKIWDDGVHFTPYGYNKTADIIFDILKDRMDTLISVP